MAHFLNNMTDLDGLNFLNVFEFKDEAGTILSFSVSIKKSSEDTKTDENV